MWAASDGDETFVLTAEAPFIAHLDASGALLSDLGDLTLSWVANAQRARLYPAPDGTLIVFGMIEPIGGEGLHIERWSRSGEKLFAGTFPGAYAASAMLEDGTVLLASAGDHDAARFTPDNTLVPRTPVSGTGSWSQSVAVNASGIATWTVDSDGETLRTFDAQGGPRGELITPSTTLDSRSCAVALDPRGAATLACLAETTGALDASLQHYTPALFQDWEGSPIKPSEQAQSLSIGTVALNDDVITTVSSSQYSTLSRHTAAGTYVGRDVIGSAHAVLLPATDDAVFVLSGLHENAGRPSFNYLTRVHVPALDHGTRQEGEPCGDANDCASEVCCKTPSGENSCGNASGCGSGAMCASSSDCSGGACSSEHMWPGPGMCWQACSGGCAAGFVCAAPAVAGAEPLCVPDCLAEGSDACADLPGYACTESTDASGFDARACLPEPPPVEAPTDLPLGATCASHEECRSGHCAQPLDGLPGELVCVDALGDPCEASGTSCRFESSTGLPSLCVVASGGSMCAEGCAVDEDCPEYYYCGEVFDGPDDDCSGFLGRVCMHTCSSGECAGGLDCRSPVCVPLGATVNVLGIDAPQCS